MQIVSARKIRTHARDGVIHLYAMGDTHLMARGCQEDSVRRDVEAIRTDKNAVAVLMGDLGDYISTDDRRWEPGCMPADTTMDDLEEWGDVVTSRILEIFRPIAKKIVVVLKGNHERAFGRRNSCNPTKRIADGLGAPYGDYTSMFDIEISAKDTGRVVSVFATHGAGAAITAGAKLNRLKRHMDAWQCADLVLVGHMHTGIMWSADRVRADRDGGAMTGRLKSETQYGVVTGSYLAAYSLGHSSYAEIKGYDPSRIGCPVIRITAARGVIGVDWT